MPASLSPGTELVAERTFTREIVSAFAAVTGDRGAHHTREDSPVVHGLLVASLPTEIGGSFDFLARTMAFEFLRPVHVGDTVRCVLRVTDAEPAERRLRLKIEGACANQDGVEVMRFSATGVVLTP